MCAVLHCRLASHGLHGTRQTVPEAVRGQSLGLSAHCSRGPARLLREVPRARRRTTAAAPTPTPRWRRAPASHCPAHPVAAPSAQPAAAACPVAAGAPPASPLRRPSDGVALSGCVGRGVFSFAGLKRLLSALPRGSPATAANADVVAQRGTVRTIRPRPTTPCSPVGCTPTGLFCTAAQERGNPTLTLPSHFPSMLRAGDKLPLRLQCGRAGRGAGPLCAVLH